MAEISMLKYVKLNHFEILLVGWQLSALKSQPFEVLFYERNLTLFITVVGHVRADKKYGHVGIILQISRLYK